MADNVWVIGVHMTKFAQHKDKDALDLATEASLSALADAGQTIHDMDVLAAGSAEELRALLATNIPDAIVMDLRLPRTDGWTLIRELKADQRTQDVPIIVVSACVRPSDREDAYRAGCDAFISKPNDPAEVLAQLRRLTKPPLS